MYRLFRLTALLFLLTPFHPAFSADPTSTVTSDTLKAKIKEIEAAAQLDEAAKAKLTELYRKTLSSLEAARSNKQAAQAFRQARQTAPGQAQQIRKKLERAKAGAPTTTIGVTAQTPLSEIDQQLLKEKADLTAVEAKLAELEKQLAQETTRPAAVRKRITEARQGQEQLTAELKLPAPEGEPPAMIEAKRWLLETQSLALSTEIRMLDQELLSQPMRLELLKAQRDQNANSAENIRARVKLLENVASERRRTEAEQSEAEAEEAKREALGKHPLVQHLAEQNALLSEEFTSLAVELERVAGDDEGATKETKRIAEDFRNAQQRLEIAGLSQALGQVLREQRRTLPDLQRFRKEAKAREQMIADAGLAHIRYTEERRRLRDLNDYIENLMADLSAVEAEAISAELKELAVSRRELLDKGIATNEAYLRALGELDFARGQLLETAAAYDSFLAEHLLWIRSGPAMSLEMLRAVPGQVAELLSPERWHEVTNTLAARATASPLPLLIAVVVIVLLWKAGQFRSSLQDTGKTVGKARTDRLSSTFHALLLTLLLAAPWPLLLASLGWLLGGTPGTATFSNAVSVALLEISVALLHLLVFRLLCEPGGLAAVHFRWPQLSLKRLRRALLRLIIVLMPAAFLTVVVIASSFASREGGLGRIGLVVVLLALATFLYQLFEPRQGALAPFMARHPRGALARLRYLWFALALAIPVTLGGLTLYGYVYTAGKLTGSLFQTMWFIFITVMVHQLAVRWLLLIRRRLAFQAILDRRKAALAAKEAEESTQAGAKAMPDETLDDVAEPEVDLVALSEEGRELLTIGLVIFGITGVWLIWSEVLPAFGILDQISLWHQTAVVDGEDKLVPVTLADMALAILVIAITIVAAKRFPALLEIILLQRLNMTSGGRYATTTLSRYLIVGTGAILAFNIIGANWSQLQWLIAALGVGIGFGLQEIVANFISGLIILFEQPIRVGDVVTIGDSDGIVTRIRIRATTIRNWDRKELLVPNKEFITGRLLNWTLSDQTTRLLIPVGIAYGSDIQKAMALILEAAEEHERVLSDPMPFVTFESFGDNALALYLRAYLGSLDYRIITISELHEAIASKFKAAGIVIAFPQRDLHLDTSRPLDIRVQHDNGYPDTVGIHHGYHEDV